MKKPRICKIIISSIVQTTKVLEVAVHYDIVILYISYNTEEIYRLCRIIFQQVHQKVKIVDDDTIIEDSGNPTGY